MCCAGCTQPCSFMNSIYELNSRLTCLDNCWPVCLPFPLVRLRVCCAWRAAHRYSAWRKDVRKRPLRARKRQATAVAVCKLSLKHPCACSCCRRVGWKALKPRTSRLCNCGQVLRKPTSLQQICNAQVPSSCRRSLQLSPSGSTHA